MSIGAAQGVVIRECELAGVVGRVEFVHGGGEAVAGPGGDGVEGAFEGGVDLGFLLGGEGLEDVGFLRDGAGGIDADAETRVVLAGLAGEGGEVGDGGLDVFEAVVAAGGAGGAEANGAGGQGDIVDDDEEVIEGDFVVGHGGGDGAAGEVHVGLGFEEEDFFAVEEDIGAKGFMGAAEVGSAVFLREGIEAHEADVVACAFVLGTGIAEADE